MFILFLNLFRQHDQKLEQYITQYCYYELLGYSAEFKYLIYGVPLKSDHEMFDTFMQKQKELPEEQYTILYSAIHYPPALAQALDQAGWRYPKDFSPESFLELYIRDLNYYLDRQGQDGYILRQLIHEADDGELMLGSFYWIQVQANGSDLLWVSGDYQLYPSKTEYFEMDP